MSSPAPPQSIGHVALCCRWHQPAYRVLLPWQLAAVGTNQLEQAVEIQRFLEHGRGVEIESAVGIERREHDDGDVGEDRVGLLLATEFPSVHDRHHEIEQDDLR